MHFLIYKNLQNVKKIIVNKITCVATDCEMRPLSFLITSPSMIGKLTVMIKLARAICMNNLSQSPTNITLYTPTTRQNMLIVRRASIGTIKMFDARKSYLSFWYSRVCSSSSALLVGKKLACLIPTFFSKASKQPYRLQVVDFIIQILCSLIHLWRVPPVKKTSSKCFERDDRKMNIKTMKNGSETCQKNVKGKSV